jgi:hypothetical protein
VTGQDLFSAAKARCLLAIQFMNPSNRQIADFGEEHTANYPQHGELDSVSPYLHGTYYSLSWYDADETDQSRKRLAKRWQTTGWFV